MSSYHKICGILYYPLYIQVANIVGKTSEDVWDIMKKIAPQLNQLQKKDDTIVNEVVQDPQTASEDYWSKVAHNCIDLAQKLQSVNQVNEYFIQSVL